MSNSPPSTAPSGEPSLTPEQINRALAEITQHRDMLSPETYRVVMAALEVQRDRLLAAATDHPEDEIRLVTVMFVDVVDSTVIAEQLGYERWREVIGEAHRRFAEKISEWGGEIGQYLGDGLMCFFGARRSQGNDAVRAVACALELQQQAYSIHTDFFASAEANDNEAPEENSPSSQPVRFQARLGISTGRVVVGIIGIEEKSETLALGTTTVRASRLQAICPPDQVLIDDETQRRVRGVFDLMACPPATLKGFAEPIANYLVIRESQQSERDQGVNQIENITVPFVGRQNVLDEVTTHLQGTQQRTNAHMLLMTGDTGMGKSRILQEIAVDPLAQRFFHVWMIAHYERRNTDHNLLRDMLARLMKLPSGISDKAAEAEITHYTTANWDSPDAQDAAAVVGALGRYGFRESAQVRSLERDNRPETRYRRYEWVRRWLRGIAGEQPVLLLLDNLQWVDPVSLDLLNYLLKNEQNLLILGAARPEFEIDASIYLDLTRVSTTTLSPLSETHTRRLISAVLTYVENVPADLVDTIVDRAEGNPLFVEEFLRMLFDIQVFRRENDVSWRMDPFQYYAMRDNNHLPDGLIGVFQARLDDLPNAERRIVQAAAVVGQTFWEGAVTAILSTPVKPWLDSLVDRRIITRRTESGFAGTDEYVFHNALYHEVAYTMLPQAVRVAYHRKVAGWLSIVATRNPRALEILATHQHRAENRIDALEAYTAAATHYLEQEQHSELQRMFDEAVKVSGTLVRTEIDAARPYMSTLWMLLAEKAYSQRNYPEATAASQTALNMLQDLPEDTHKHERLRAAVTLGNAHASLGHYEAALDALTNGYQYVGDEQDPAQRTIVLRAFAQLFWVRGNLVEATLYGQRALADAGASGSVRELSATQAVLGRILADQGRLEESLTIFERVSQINQRDNHLLYQVEDLLMIADIYHHLFAYDMALGMLQQAEVLCQRINYRPSLLGMIRGEIMIAKGNPEQGLADLQAAYKADHPNQHTRYLVYLGYLRGLVQANKPNETLVEAGQFIREIQDHSPLLHGRVQLWLGMAQHHLQRPGAEDNLWSALASETTHGGRDLWMCHYALSVVLQDSRTANEHRQMAYTLLSQRAATISQQPDLYAISRNPSWADAIFEDSQPDAGTA